MSDRPQFPPRPQDRFPQRPPFRPPGPSRPPDGVPAPHSLRLRDGDREIDVSGSPAFVRQILDDLPALLARLRGEQAPTHASIRMPAPPVAPAVEPAAATTASVVAEAEPVVARVVAAPPPPSRADPEASVEARIFEVLRGAPRPLAIAAIRERLGDTLTGQQVRRILERAGSRVVASGDKPMRYRLRG